MEPVGRSPCKLTFDHIELRRSVTLQPVQFWSKPRGEQIYLLFRGAAQNVLRQQDNGASREENKFICYSEAPPKMSCASKTMEQAEREPFR